MKDGQLQMPPPPVAMPQGFATPQAGLPIEGLVGRTVSFSALTGLVLVALFLPLGVDPALGALAGLVLNLIGLWTLSRLVPLVLRPLSAPAAPRALAVKYALGHLASLTAILPLLFVVDAKGFLAGYSYPLLILMLKALGRVLFGENARPQPQAAPVAEKPAAVGSTTRTLAGVLVFLLLPLGAVAGARALGDAPRAGVVVAEAPEEEGATHEEAATEEHGEGEAAGGAHGEGHGKAAAHSGPPHVPTLFDWVNAATGFKQQAWYTGLSETLGLSKGGHEVLSLEYLFWYFFTIVLLIVVLAKACAKPQRIPKGFQALMETFLGFITDLVEGVIPGGKKYIPFVATLFLFILTMNYLGLVPGYNGPTAVLNTTAALAICVFVYAQFEGIRTNGPGHYFMHFVGEPLWLAPLMFPLHVVGEFIKPLSLALRLFGNLNGEHILAAGFITLIAGIGIGVSWFPLPVPVHAVLLPLGLLVGFIQAMVFSLLSTIYIFLLLPHDDHGHGEAAHHH